MGVDVKQRPAAIRALVQAANWEDEGIAPDTVLEAIEEREAAAQTLVSNDFARGMLLQGQYATINIHPDAFKKFPGVNFTPVVSPALFPYWIATSDSAEMIPQTLEEDFEHWIRQAERS